MLKTVGIGHQDFTDIRRKNIFYVDKTYFIKEWWEHEDSVTLITRPRRFGKTLMMSTVDTFFSVNHAGDGELFEGLEIWRDKKYRSLQGTIPVISLSFANVKEDNYFQTRRKICQLLVNLYAENSFLLDSDILSVKDCDYYRSISVDMEDAEASLAIHKMSEFLSGYYGKKVMILLDEYDTPIQEAYVNGYWEELISFIRNLFNATFKTNPYLDRALLTGITRISKESVFSDLNNPIVITTTSNDYADCFGFSEKEVFHALDEYGLSEDKQKVKEWYDGFTFGKVREIYNPWSIINYLRNHEFATYWANTSSNALIGKLIRESSADIKITMENLLKGDSFKTQIDEQIVFNQLDYNEKGIWSLLLASGYLRVEKYVINEKSGREEYELALTNKEVHIMFEKMIQEWFAVCSTSYNEFIKALLKTDVKAMNAYMNKVALTTFSFFDTGKNPSEATEPERFYHGFVLGLMVDLSDRYVITSNRESGFGRYDVLLEPKNKSDLAIVLEFKVHDPEEENSLKDTVQKALEQITDKKYTAELMAKGIPGERICEIGFAFRGKEVLIKKK